MENEARINQELNNGELTAEQKREVFYSGGLKAVVTLSGQKLLLGELPLKDRGKIFQCFEDDIRGMQKTYREYAKKQSSGIFRALLSFIKAVFGIDENEKPAISIVKQFVEGMTENDIKLLTMCAEGRNGMKNSELRTLILESTPSEVQRAIKEALEINGIDTKKLQAERERIIPAISVKKTTTSTVG